MRAFGEARLAALKTRLSLTPEQQAGNWAAFEQAARDLGKLRIDRRIALRSATPCNDPVERLRRRASQPEGRTEAVRAFEPHRADQSWISTEA